MLVLGVPVAVVALRGPVFAVPVRFPVPVAVGGHPACIGCRQRGGAPKVSSAAGGGGRRASGWGVMMVLEKVQKTLFLQSVPTRVGRDFASLLDSNGLDRSCDGFSVSLV